MNGDLVVVTLRLRRADVAAAKQVAKQSLSPFYQHVIRGWVADGAERSQKRVKR